MVKQAFHLYYLLGESEQLRPGPICYVDRLIFLLQRQASGLALRFTIVHVYK